MKLEQEDRVRCGQHRQESRLACELWETRCQEQERISPIWHWKICPTCLHLPKGEAAKQDLEELTIMMATYKLGQDQLMI